MYDSGIQIQVKKDTGNEISLEVKTMATIGDIKVMIQDRVGIHPDKQRLLFNGKELEDDKTVREENIRDDSTLHLSLPPTGMAFM